MNGIRLSRNCCITIRKVNIILAIFFIESSHVFNKIFKQ